MGAAGKQSLQSVVRLNAISKSPHADSTQRYSYTQIQPLLLIIIHTDVALLITIAIEQAFLQLCQEVSQISGESEAAKFRHLLKLHQVQRRLWISADELQPTVLHR